MSLRNQPFRNWLSCSIGSVLVLCLIALMIELDGSFGLFLLADKVGQKITQNGNAFASITPRHIEETVSVGILPVTSTVHSDLHIVKVAEGFYGSGVSHLYGKCKSISMCFSTISGSHSFDGDTTFTINETGKICFIHPEIKDTTKHKYLQEFFSDNLPNSVDTRLVNTKGNTEPSIVVEKLRGRVYRLCGRPVREDIVSSLPKCKECDRNDRTPANNAGVTKKENQDASAALILFQGNMTTNNRRKLAVIQGFTA